ncbi:MAG: DUF952 domain-containing protein [Thermomicrobiales bacterium]|nr:DUF952 domain-containing protein [Thermomicrobiales bacterium]
MTHRIPVPPEHQTWHMTAVDVWEAQKGSAVYRPEAWAEDGFIHCTDDLEELLAVGNRYYRDDPRPWLAVHIDCDRISDPVVYEDAARLFPHIYGDLPLQAVTGTIGLVRDQRGSFVAVGARENVD